jgi:hypothetical protein
MGSKQEPQVLETRNAALKKRFNEAFPVGSTVQFRNHEMEPWRTSTVRSEAFCEYGNVVVFFEGVRGYWSVEPEFVNYEAKEGL